MTDPFLKTNCFSKYADVKSYLICGDPQKVPSPTVTVIMPVFRGGKYFEIALNSVLNQDYTEPFEIVIVDNNPLSEGVNENQKLVERINRKEILYYRHDRNIGMYPNWNRGIELARADYVTFCHDDDMLLPNALSLLMAIRKKTGDKAIFSQYNIIDENNDYINKICFERDTRIPFIKRKYYYNFNLLDHFCCGAAIGVGDLFNKKCMIELGGYDEDNYPSGDTDTHAAYTHFYGSVMNCIPTFCYRKTVNESLSVYANFASDNKFAHECSRVFFPIPNCILDVFIKSKFRWAERMSAMYWGKIPEDKAPKIKKYDTKILGLLNFILKFHRVEITFK